DGEIVRNAQGLAQTEIVKLKEQSLRLKGEAEVALAGVDLAGSMDIAITSEGLMAEADLRLGLGALGNIRVGGGIAILNTASEGAVFAMRGVADVVLGIGDIGIEARATLEINTSNERDLVGVQAGRDFRVGLKGTMNMLAL